MLDIEIGGRVVTLAISIDQLKRQGHPNENDIYLRQIDKPREVPINGHG